MNYENVDPVVLTHRKEKGEEKIPDSSLKDPAQMDMEKLESAKRKRCVSMFKIVWSFISFLISVADVTVILYLSYVHFSHASDLIAWIMLLPILLNFIGMFTFLSNKAERREMESLGCGAVKNLMFFPVIGPSFASLRLFFYAFEEEDAEKFERLESLLIRMKQYESFFRAPPEVFIQVTFRIITWSGFHQYHDEDAWTSACIILCIFSLAESHMFGLPIRYYRMFKYDPTPNAWKTDHISLKWKIILFIYTYFSINSRLFADAIQKATCCFFFSDESFGEVIVINFLSQFVVRAAIFGIYNAGWGSEKRKAKIHEQGVYGAFTYAWRCSFISLDFQSYTKVIFCWFYIENCLMLLVPYIWIYGTPWFGGTGGSNVLKNRMFFHVYAGLGLIANIVAVAIKIGVRYHFKRRKKGKIGNSSPGRPIVEK